MKIKMVNGESNKELLILQLAPCLIDPDHGEVIEGVHHGYALVRCFASVLEGRRESSSSIEKTLSAKEYFCLVVN